VSINGTVSLNVTKLDHALDEIKEHAVTWVVNPDDPATESLRESVDVTLKPASPVITVRQISGHSGRDGDSGYDEPRSNAIHENPVLIFKFILLINSHTRVDL
jgi:hypothetical protein